MRCPAIMENTPPPAASSSLPWPPGTIKLTDGEESSLTRKYLKENTKQKANIDISLTLDGGETKVFHHPKPTDDYDDPLVRLYFVLGSEVKLFNL